MALISAASSIRTDEEWIKTAINERNIKYIDPKKLNLVGKLGSGGFATVHSAVWNHGVKIPVAAKFLKSLEERKSDQDSYKEFIKELRLHHETSCYDNIIKFYGVSKDTKTGQYILITEYCNGGSLRSYLEYNFKKMAWMQKLRLSRETISGLTCLHEDGILHRDLNSANVFVHNDTIKIGDLGLSKRADDNNNSSTSAVRGHIAYVDPQCINDEFYIRGKKSDIYSLGVILWELSSGRLPFQGQGKDLITRRVLNGERENPIQGTPTEYVNLYIQCWHESPDKRPSAEEAYNQVQEIIRSTTDSLTDDPLKTKNSISVIKDPATMNPQTLKKANTVYAAKISNNLTHEQHGTQIPKDPATCSTIDSRSVTEDSDTTNIAPVREQYVNPEYLDRVFDGLMKVTFGSLSRGKEWENTSQEIIDYLEKGNLDSGELFKFLDIRVKRNQLFPFFQKEYSKYASLLGLFYYGGIGTEKDDRSAFDIFSYAAQNGDLSGQYFRGNCYQNGIGVKKDCVKAVRWYTKSAEGNVLGQNALGLCYENGLCCENRVCVEKDLFEAIRWYKESAKDGNTLGQASLGYCYEKTNDLVRAVYWYAKSANGGNPRGQKDLGRCYEKGISIKKDPAKAFYWYKKSAEGGNMDGLAKLANCYRNGIGVGQDLVKAAYWNKIWNSKWNVTTT